MRKRKSAGFTLVELIVTLAIAAIVMTMGVPSFQELTRNNRMVAEINSVSGALALARSEAVKRKAAVGVCPTTGANNPNWEQGWRVFIDANGDTQRNDDEEVLSVGDRIDNGDTLRSKNFQLNCVVYDARGRLVGAAGSLVLCDSRGAPRARAINVNRIGRAASAVDGDDNGIVEDIGGGDVNCPL